MNRPYYVIQRKASSDNFPLYYTGDGMPFPWTTQVEYASLYTKVLNAWFNRGTIAELRNCTTVPVQAEDIHNLRLGQNQVK